MSNHATTKARPVRIAGAVVNTINSVAAGVSAIGVLQDNPTVALVSAVVIVVTSAVSQSLIPVLEGKVTPAQDVLAFRNADGAVVAGHAAPEIAAQTDDTGHPDYQA